jgi:hypothetical protein
MPPLFDIVLKERFYCEWSIFSIIISTGVPPKISFKKV